MGKQQFDLPQMGGGEKKEEGIVWEKSFAEGGREGGSLSEKEKKISNSRGTGVLQAKQLERKF